ncbi:PAS domain S-box protein [Salipaludibacillus neizhouensis]|nr:PAS domain S-box protein [Salipaludibacillus neizhouensis]
MSDNNHLSISEREEMYRQIVEYSFETTIIHSDNRILYINQSGADFFKTEKKTIIGAKVVDVFTDEFKEVITERIRRATEENQIGELIETTVHIFDGTNVDVELYCHPVNFGDRQAIQSIIRDITSRKESEKKLKRLISEVATPIVPVFEGIAVIPIVGEIDEDRTQQLIDIIPQKIQGHDLQYLIIDVSGIYNIDEVVINFLYEISAIMKLLGISLIFTGLRPGLARKAVSSCPNVTSLRTMSNVKQALNLLIKT